MHVSLFIVFSLHCEGVARPLTIATAILSTPIFSVTGELVYIASAGPQFAAVMLQDGSSAWSVDTENIIETSPVLGEDVVYTIEVGF